jgi:type II secretory pathway pseudopilin PulG
VILLCALAVGGAASLLASARSEGPPPLGGPTTEIIFPSWIVAAAILGFLAALVVPLVYYRLRYAKSGVPGRFIVGATSFLLAMVIFVVLTRFIVSPGGGFTSPGSGNGNNSTGGQPPPNSTGPPAIGPGGALAPFNLHLPSWTLYVVVVVAVIGLAVAGVPRLAEYLEERREARRARSRVGEVAAQVQSALREAAEALGAGKDPRLTILALYAELLARIRPLVKTLDHETPEEIRRLHLTRLGIRPGAAEDLTRTFEEARYSSHPLGPEAVERTTAAIRAAEADLERRGVEP